MAFLRRFSDVSRKESSLPRATWSLRQLQLSPTATSIDGCIETSLITPQEVPTISDQELNSLARRCLIDIHEEEREELKHNLNNILHCTSLVCNIDRDDLTMKEEDLYDIPRGLGTESSCPLRQDSEMEQESRSNHSENKAKEVLDRLQTKGKMVKLATEDDKGQGEENWYFSLVTKGKDL